MAVCKRGKQIMQREKVFKSHELKDEFYKIFGFCAPINRNVSPFFGYLVLDIVELDSMFDVPDGVSLKEHIKNKYGDKAVSVVEEWIKL